MRTIASAFTLAAACLAATPALAGDAKLHWKDLDLATEAGRAELDRRIDVAARTVCAPEAVTGSRLARSRPSAACLAEARSHMSAQVAAKSERLAKAPVVASTATAARR